MEQEPTSMEILQAIKDFSDRMDRRLDAIEERLDRLEARVSSLEARVDRIETITMATKNQLQTLIEILEKNSVISSFEAAHVARQEAAG